MPKDPSSFPFFVFGNKKDREAERSVGQQQARDWCKKNNGIPWEETSALDSHCIEKAFDRIAHIMLRRTLQDKNPKYVNPLLTCEQIVQPEGGRKTPRRQSAQEEKERLLLITTSIICPDYHRSRARELLSATKSCPLSMTLLSTTIF